MHFLTTQRILKNALTDEARHTVLRKSLTRYRSELLDDEGCQLLLGRIRLIRRQLRLA
jgi:hypothetical protein